MLRKKRRGRKRNKEVILIFIEGFSFLSYKSPSRKYKRVPDLL